ncbi:MAG: DNA mismatch repair endonuclease MutL [Cyanobacterium sp. T60_A2020_053]|nr:DNA mismatch repair endonuclease MutL [Cyanobacterium sp. T60_A2020_053]
MRINKLPLEVIKLIAAGEVIDSLTAVVKELVENSLDAQAKRIVITIYPELWMVQVADNGTGISALHLSNAPLAHTTSKISSCQDLNNIQTLGFRGEALHSISQLAELTIASRIKGDCGYQWHENKNITPCALAEGTIITVNNLFHNIPLRRQANPPFKQQIKQIQILIGEFALCHPQVTWQLLINDKLSLHINGKNQADHILLQLLKSINYTDLKAQKFSINNFSEDHNSQLEIVLGLPDRLSRPRPDWVKIGVNGRVIKSPELESAIFSSFHRTLPRDRFPVVFVHLHISPRHIDWNRHPTKREIYLHNLDFWQQQIKESIEQIFTISEQTISNQRVEKLLTVAENKPIYQIEKKENTASLGLIELKVIAQSRHTYIIAEHSEGIWLIEQHIAHERIIYEQLLKQWEFIPLSQPQIFEHFSPRQVEHLDYLGFDIDSFGEGLWALRNMPQLLHSRDDMTEAVWELARGADLDSAKVAVACRSALRNGTPLTISEMQNLVDQWKITRNPHTCPHGRPIYLSLEESSLYRFFRRHWVLGKSHGIN